MASLAASRSAGESYPSVAAIDGFSSSRRPSARGSEHAVRRGLHERLVEVPVLESRSPSTGRTRLPAGSTPHRAVPRRRAAAMPSSSNVERAVPEMRWRSASRSRSGRAVLGRGDGHRCLLAELIDRAIPTGSSGSSMSVSPANRLELLRRCAAASSVACSTAASSRFRSVTSRRTMSTDGERPNSTGDGTAAASRTRTTPSSVVIETSADRVSPAHTRTMKSVQASRPSGSTITSNVLRSS